VLRRRPLNCRIVSVDQFFRTPLLKAHADGSPPRSPVSGGAAAFVLSRRQPSETDPAGRPHLTRSGHGRRLLRRSTHALAAGVQSRSGPVKWLAPEVAETLRALAAEGRTQVLMASFPSSPTRSRRSTRSTWSTPKRPAPSVSTSAARRPSTTHRTSSLCSPRSPHRRRLESLAETTCRGRR
jgi:hypothetical protein